MIRSLFICRQVARVRVTRASLREQIERPEKLRQQAILQRQQLEKQILALPFNDSNPDNFIKVLVRAPVLAKGTVPSTPEIQYVKRFEHIKPDLVVTKKALESSPKRTIAVARIIGNKHVLDALGYLTFSLKKPTSAFRKSLVNALDHAKMKGLDPKRLMIHRVLVGRHLKHRKIRYHARGKNGRAYHRESNYRIQFKEQSREEFYGNAARGRFPKGLSGYLRQILRQKEASLEQIAKYQPILTSRGKHVQAEQFRRKVYLRRQEKGLTERNAVALVLKEEWPRFEEMVEEIAKMRKDSSEALRLRSQAFRNNSAKFN